MATIVCSVFSVESSLEAGSRSRRSRDTVAAMLKPGDKAPDFTLLDQNGEPFTLSKSLKAYGT
jgi:cytochrome oxidase Cu insertion factor (SCO1/SenC/PrrC family)